MPGTRDGLPVMLKIALVDEEVRGAALLRWWAGRGAAPVLEQDERATLLARATGTRDLAAMVASGADAEVTGILVGTALALHERPAPSARDGVQLVPLRRWFRDLLTTDSDDPVLLQAAGIAEHALTTTMPEDVVALHGDIHHGNVLDFGDRWAAIDPKGLIGHRAFDVANILCNPTEAAALGNLTARLNAIGRQANIPPVVLSQWTIAWCGLSLVWSRGDSPPTWHARAARGVAEQLLGGLTPRRNPGGTFSITA